MRVGRLPLHRRSQTAVKGNTREPPPPPREIYHAGRQQVNLSVDRSRKGQKLRHGSRIFFKFIIKDKLVNTLTVVLAVGCHQQIPKNRSLLICYYKKH